MRFTPVAPVPPIGDHAYVKGPFPTAVTVPLPLFPPKQVTSVGADIVAVGPPELSTVTVCVFVQPFASVIRQV